MKIYDDKHIKNRKLFVGAHNSGQNNSFGNHALRGRSY